MLEGSRLVGETHRQLLTGVRNHYEGCLERHGATPRGVDWNDLGGQLDRLEDLLSIVPNPTYPFTINDFGCGYGVLAELLRESGASFSYTGYDLSEAMVQAGLERCEGDPRIRFTSDPNQIEPADFTVASGLLNVKMDTPTASWKAYVLDLIHDLALLSRRGFAFNALSSFVDPARRRSDLHYADPLALTAHCASEFSKRVALLHDRWAWEFTLLVRLEDPSPPGAASLGRRLGSTPCRDC